MGFEIISEIGMRRGLGSVFDIVKGVLGAKLDILFLGLLRKKSIRA
jgi:hypothetical protein